MLLKLGGECCPKINITDEGIDSSCGRAVQYNDQLEK